MNFNKIAFIFLTLFSAKVICTPQFVKSTSPVVNRKIVNSPIALCNTAKNTLAFLQRGKAYDPLVIHDGAPGIPLEQVKKTLEFICQHPQEMADPQFIQTHFNFVQWMPDQAGARTMAPNNKLLNKLPSNKILLTKYYVHLGHGALSPSAQYPYALYSIPEDERFLTLDEANRLPNLTRFKFGKQEILRGALTNQKVQALSYLSRPDLEAALLQGTIVTKIAGKAHIFNVQRNNNIPYVRTKTPAEQQRYWYFTEVDSIKGYGKGIEDKISIDPQVTFAGNVKQLGLGKLILINYNTPNGEALSRLGILADTGGAFEHNLFQLDFLCGAYSTPKECYTSWQSIPDYVTAYFLVLKKEFL